MSRAHLTHDDRIRLASLKRAGLKQKDFAFQLGKNPSTISREICLMNTKAPQYGVTAERWVFGTPSSSPQRHSR